MSNKNNKKAIIAVAILLVLVIGAIIAWVALRPAAPERHPAAVTTQSPADGSSADPTQTKADEITIVVSVTHADGSEKEFVITTAALNLREALEQENLVQGDESEYGLFVTTVDGETVDGSKQEWWCFTKGGEMMMTGVDDTMIADGDHYEIVFTVGW